MIQHDIEICEEPKVCKYEVAYTSTLNMCLSDVGISRISNKQTMCFFPECSSFEPVCVSDHWSYSSIKSDWSLYSHAAEGIKADSES